LFNIDNIYWRYYSRYSTKYIDIHLIDTILIINNTLFITYFESYSPPKGDFCGTYYGIKLMKLKDDMVISVFTLAEYQNYSMGDNSICSYLLPGNKIVTNQESHGYSDDIGENGQSNCRTVYSTRYLLFERVSQTFKVFLETEKIRDS
jgi:hypothetical protein